MWDIRVPLEEIEVPVQAPLYIPQWTLIPQEPGDPMGQLERVSAIYAHVHMWCYLSQADPWDRLVPGVSGSLVGAEVSVETWGGVSRIPQGVDAFWYQGLLRERERL
jgi:hypothetical protein